MALTFANKITLCRILAVPFFIAALVSYTPERDYLRFVALGIFLFAVISDVIDGYVARRWRQKTKAGAILDPVADKLLLMSAFICLYFISPLFNAVKLPLWFVVLVISRDFILLVGAMIIHIMNGDLEVEATLWGKVCTFFQVLTVLDILMQWKLSPAIWYITIIFIIVSAFDYVRTGIKVLNNGIETKL